MTLAALALAALTLLSAPADDRRFKIVVDHKTGYIDAAGHEVIPPRYDGGRRFTEGLAAVRVESKWGYVDTSGRFVWKTTPKDPTYHLRSDARPAHIAGELPAAVLRHHLEQLLADRSPEGEPVFVAVRRRDPSREVIAALRAYRVDVRPFSARAAFARHWSSINTAPAGDSEAVSTGVLILVERLGLRSPVEAEAVVQVSYAAVGNADGSTMIYRDRLAWSGAAWKVASEEVIGAAG